jgi:RNA-directed DNA polymerase
MDASRQEEPAGVAAGPTQGGDIRARWAWVEASVWTDRMLTALEKGVKGGVWFSLIDKVYAPANLRAAFKKVARNGGAAGVDHVTVEDFGHRLEAEIEGLHRGLRDGIYQPQMIRRTFIDKPGTTEKRPLGIPTVRDRVVQGALRHALEPIFEKEFAAHSYGFRPGRGCKDALRRVDGLIQRGYRHTVDVDLKSYFDTIPHEALMGEVRKRIADGRVLGLIEAFLKVPILEGLESWEPERGAPQGAVLSPLLSNLYLDGLDHVVAARGYEMTRYADDLVIQCRTPQEAESALALVRDWVTARGLTLHPTKTKIVDVEADGFDFLGYHFEKRFRTPRKKSLEKLRDSIRDATRRTNGTSLERVIARVSRTLRGWFEYFKHSRPGPFRALDGWIRMRLRSILRRRRGGRGRGRGSDHQRWPNAFFTARGLYSLVAARAAIRRSPRG